MNQLCDECFFLAIINLQIISSENTSMHEYTVVSWDKVITTISFHSRGIRFQGIQFKI